jgi:hypothetical protein
MCEGRTKTNREAVEKGRKAGRGQGTSRRQVGTRWKTERQRWTVGRGCKEMGRRQEIGRRQTDRQRGSRYAGRKRLR